MYFASKKKTWNLTKGVALNVRLLTWECSAPTWQRPLTLWWATRPHTRPAMICVKHLIRGGPIDSLKVYIPRALKFARQCHLQRWAVVRIENRQWRLAQWAECDHSSRPLTRLTPSTVDSTPRRPESRRQYTSASYIQGSHSSTWLIAILASKLSTQPSTRSTGPSVKLPCCNRWQKCAKCST